MPGSELFGIEERREIDEVLETGVLFRFNHDVHIRARRTAELRRSIVQNAKLLDGIH